MNHSYACEDTGNQNIISKQTVASYVYGEITVYTSKMRINQKFKYLLNYSIIAILSQTEMTIASAATANKQVSLENFCLQTMER